jgi:hypothetical protein
MKIVFSLFISLLVLACKKEPEPLTITFTGDIILDRGVADELNIYGDSIIERSLKPLLRSDFNVINLETVLTNETHSVKNGLTFCYDPSIAKNLYSGNVTHASVANNHSNDYGSLGLTSTLSALDKHSIAALGSSCEPTLISKGSQYVAIMAASFTTNNEHLCISNVNELLVMVKEFEAQHPDIPLILYLHWGLEYQQVPEKWQSQLAHDFIDSGADVIIGHHPHVFQSIEYYSEKPIVYSLGNFVTDAYLPNTTQGVIATLTFTDQALKLSIAPVDISSYLPAKMSDERALKFLLDNLKYSKEMCLYKSNNQWLTKDIADVDFSEKASAWLFHYENEYQVIIKPMTSGGHKLTLFKNGVALKSLALNGKLSEISIGDINNDNEPEILLGIAKKVNFDPRERKRLNIFKVENDGIQVVWLGTHLLHDLQSFRISRNKNVNYLYTIERDSLNNTKKGIYEWDEFGFALKTIEPIYANN